LLCISLEVTALILEAAGTSETTVKLYQSARRNIPQGSLLHTGRRENLKSHTDFLVLAVFHDDRYLGYVE
jgi:hypothetical protein